MIEHPDDFARLVAHDLLLLLVIQRWDREATDIVWFRVEKDVTEMCEVLVQWIWSYIVAWFFLIRSREAPSWISLKIDWFTNTKLIVTLFTKMPVNRSIWNDLPQALQFPDNESTMCFERQCL